MNQRGLLLKLVLLLAGFLACSAPSLAGSTINDLYPVVPFPLLDPGQPASSVENLWISLGNGPGTDFRITPTQLGYIYQGITPPSAPFVYELWWNTSTNPATLTAYNGYAWLPIGTLGMAWSPAGTWTGGIISPVYGGTGENNGTNTLTLAGPLAITGSGPTTLIFPSATARFTYPPATDTLAGLAATQTLTATTLHNGALAGTTTFSGPLTGSGTITTSGSLVLTGTPSPNQTYGILANGAFTYGIDFSAGYISGAASYSAAPVRLNNTGFIVGRNHGNTTDFNLVGVSSADKIDLGDLVTSSTGTPGVEIDGTGSVTAVNIYGAYSSWGIDMKSATLTGGGALRLPNGSSIFEENAAGSLPLQLIGMNNSNIISIGMQDTVDPATGNTLIPGTLIVTGTMTAAAGGTVGNLGVGGTLGVTGAAALNGAIIASSLPGTTAGAGKVALCMDATSKAFYVSSTASC